MTGSRASGSLERAPLGEHTRFALDRPFHHDGGLAFLTDIPANALPLLEDPAVRELARVCEEDTPLSSPTDIHDYIRQSGHGSFSVWEDQVYLSSSDGSDPTSNGRRYELWLPLRQTAARARRFPLRRPFSEFGAHLLHASLPAPSRELLTRRPDLLDYALVLEDGVPLPQPERHHQRIADFGAGRYRVTVDGVDFSSAAGDAGAGERRYEIEVPDPALVQAIGQARTLEIIESDQQLLELITRNVAENNTCLSNFFDQGTNLVTYLRDHGLTLHGDVVVLGCGNVPWVPLRALAEGARTVIANDLQPVLQAFPDPVVEPFLDVLESVLPQLRAALDARKRPAGPQQTTFEGLVHAGGMAFEHLELARESTDLVTSTSVLEHVMDAQAVYAAMANTLRPGGLMAHWIDLRDHLAFHDPLRFLHLSHDEYAAINTENRLRASDHLRLLEDNGFEVVDAAYWRTPGDPVLRAPWLPWAEIEPTVTEADRVGFDPAFQHHELTDLSIVGMRFIAVRR